MSEAFAISSLRGLTSHSGNIEILQNMTGPGHSTILSGAFPYQSGIALNNWFDAGKQAGVYCVQDDDSPIVGGASDGKSLGLSPKNFRATTVGDELKNAGYPSRVVSLSLKDRASILMGGHRADIALWFDTKSQRWVSSRFYLGDAKSARLGGGS